MSCSLMDVDTIIVCDTDTDTPSNNLITDAKCSDHSNNCVYANDMITGNFKACTKEGGHDPSKCWKNGALDDDCKGKDSETLCQDGYIKTFSKNLSDCNPDGVTCTYTCKNPNQFTPAESEPVFVGDGFCTDEYGKHE